MIRLLQDFTFQNSVGHDKGDSKACRLHLYGFSPRRTVFAIESVSDSCYQFHGIRPSEIAKLFLIDSLVLRGLEQLLAVDRARPLSYEISGVGILLLNAKI